jgi:hypothetical protein
LACVIGKRSAGGSCICACTHRGTVEPAPPPPLLSPSCPPGSVQAGCVAHTGSFVKAQSQPLSSLLPAFCCCWALLPALLASPTRLLRGSLHAPLSPCLMLYTHCAMHKLSYVQPMSGVAHGAKPLPKPHTGSTSDEQRMLSQGSCGLKGGGGGGVVRLVAVPVRAACCFAACGCCRTAGAAQGVGAAGPCLAGGCPAGAVAVCQRGRQQGGAGQGCVSGEVAQLACAAACMAAAPPVLEAACDARPDAPAMTHTTPAVVNSSTASAAKRMAADVWRARYAGSTQCDPGELDGPLGQHGTPFRRGCAESWGDSRAVNRLPGACVCIPITCVNHVAGRGYSLKHALTEKSNAC